MDSSDGSKRKRDIFLGNQKLKYHTKFLNMLIFSPIYQKNGSLYFFRIKIVGEVEEKEGDLYIPN